MPDTKNNKEKDPRYEQFVKEFKAGLIGAESGGDYKAVNKLAEEKYGKGSNMIALGKYQFVPKYHWSDIQKIAKENGRPVPQTHEEYLNDQALQELHFDWYTKNKIWPVVKRDSVKAAERGLSMGEYGYFNHFEPSSAQKFIKTGEHRKGTDLNPSSEKVINNFRKFRDKSKVQPFYGYTDDDLRGEYFHYNARIKKIDENENYSEEVKATLKQELYNKYRDQGYITPDNPDGTPTGFNRIIQEINRGKEEEYNNNLASIEEEMNIIKNSNILYNPTDKGAKGLTLYYTPFNEEEAKKFAEFKKKNPEMFKTGYNGLNEINPKFIKNFEKKYENITGEKINLLNDDLSKGKDLSIDVDKLSYLGNKFGEAFGEKTSYKGTAIIDKKINPKKDSIQKINFIDYIPPVTNNEETETEQTAPVNPTDATERELVQTRRPSDGVQREQMEEELYSDMFFQDKREVPEGIDSQDFKDNFPYAELLGNAAGAFAGMAMADKRIPMRDEQVSGAFRNYAAELKKLSEIGLRPEEEAYAKRMLTESYTSSIDQVVKASGGNRNLVLGNLGRVDAQKNKSLIELAVADAAAKTDALHKYGQATQYINEFDARRDIANNERKYKDVLMTKEAGAQLAQASFAGLIDTLQNYQDNKPGSANHLYRSHMYRTLLGYDPQLKDDDTGNIKWTFSWMKKNNEKTIQSAKEFNEIKSIYDGMSHEEKKQMNQFMKENGFENYGDYARELVSKRGKTSSEDVLKEDEVYLDLSTMFNEEKANYEDGMIAKIPVQQYEQDEIANEQIKTSDILAEEKQDQAIEKSKPIAGGYNPSMLQKYPTNSAYNSAKANWEKSNNGVPFMSEEDFGKIYEQQF